MELNYDIYLKIFKWLHPETKSAWRLTCRFFWKMSPCPCYDNPLLSHHQAVKNGHLVCLYQIIEKHPHKLSHKLDNIAAEYNRLEVLMWLTTIKETLSPTMANIAAKHGHLNFLKYVHRIGCPVTPDCSLSAASGGNLNIIKWLVDVQIPIHTDIVYYAVESRNCQLVKFLFYHNFRADIRACSLAIDTQNFGIIKLIEKNYGFQGLKRGELLGKAVRLNDYPLTKWMIKHGFKIHSHFLELTTNPEIHKLLQGGIYTSFIRRTSRFRRQIRHHLNL